MSILDQYDRLRSMRRMREDESRWKDEEYGDRIQRRKRLANTIQAEKSARHESMLRIPADHFIDLVEEFIVDKRDNFNAEFEIMEMLEHLRLRIRALESKE